MSLRWTKEVPVSPGRWWIGVRYEDGEIEELGAVDVYDQHDGGGLRVTKVAEYWGRGLNDPTPDQLEHWMWRTKDGDSLLWAGPIPTPDEGEVVDDLPE